MGARRALGPLALALAAAACAPQAATPAPFDPVTMDPVADAAHPASMDGVTFTSHGASLNGRIYEAAGAGPHPTLLMLHGFPGSEQNLDIAQAVRRAGWNVVLFHYRGSWGSGGEFTLGHVLEDSAAVADAIRVPQFAGQHRIDPGRVSVFGHSMGGFAAILTASARPELRCLVSVAGANFGALAAAAGADPAVRARAEATFQAWGTGPIANMSGARMVAEAIDSRAAFDVLTHLRDVAARPVLLVAANADVITPPAQNHDPELAALRAAGATRVQELRFDTDHAFSDVRIALTRGVIGFLQTNCR